MAGSTDNLVVGTHTRHLLVYRDAALLWAAKTDLLPVAVRIAEFGGVAGMLALLDDEGRLGVQYMGTEPPVTSVAYAEARKCKRASAALSPSTAACRLPRRLPTPADA